MTKLAYEPSTTLTSRVVRRMTPFLARRTLKVNLERPLITFTFDDCPVSAIKNGAKRLEQKGWRSTIYVAAGLFGITNHHGKMAGASDVKAAYNAGHEIGGHSFSHVDMSNISTEDLLVEIERNQIELANNLIPPSRSFAFPFGETRPQQKQILGTKFEALRGIQPGSHKDKVDLNQIKSEPLFTSKNINELVDKIKGLKTNPAWMTLFTHDVRNNPSLWGCSPEEFQRVVDAVEEIDAIVLPLIEAVDYLKARS